MDTTHVVGNLTADPELRFSSAGRPFATFTVARNRRWQNRQTQEWAEATDFFNCVMWGDSAENVGESLHKGDRAIVLGEFRQRSWETDDGDKRSTVELHAVDAAPSLRWATAQVVKNDRKGPAPKQNQPPASAYDEEPF